MCTIFTTHVRNCEMVTTPMTSMCTILLAVISNQDVGKSRQSGPDHILNKVIEHSFELTVSSVDPDDTLQK